MIEESRNSFFNISVLKFALTKRKKVQRYSKDKKSVANLTGVDLLDIKFEDWVLNKEYRIDITKKILGYYSSKHEKNIEIYNLKNSKMERILLRLLGLAKI